MTRIGTAAEAERAIEDLAALIEKLTGVVEQETGLVHAGHTFAAACSLEPVKVELTGQLLMHPASA